jgi:lysophospholipase L1-like esterase
VIAVIGRWASFVAGLGRAGVVAAMLAGGAAGAAAAGLSPACAVPESLLTLSGDTEHAAAHLRDWGGLRILAIGSSSTEGVGASSRAATYPARLQVALSRLLPGRVIHVVNRGRSGEVAAQTVHRLHQLVALLQPDLVAWQLGTNDAVRHVGLAAFDATVEDGLSFLRQRGIDVVLIDPQHYPRIDGSADYAAVVHHIADLAAQAHVPLLRRFAAMEAWAALPPTVRRPMLSRDHFHMNDQGYDCLAQVLAEGLARRLEPPTVPVAAATPAQRQTVATLAPAKAATAAAQPAP